jgi:hypothetical protein
LDEGFFDMVTPERRPESNQGGTISVKKVGRVHQIQGSSYNVNGRTS